MSEKVAAEHLGLGQREPPVIHCLEYDIGELVVVRDDLREHNLVHQPIREMDYIGCVDAGIPAVLEIRIAVRDILDGSRVGVGNGVSAVLEKREHAGIPVLDVEIELLLAEIVAVDEPLDIRNRKLFDVAVIVEEINHEKGDGGDALLAIDNGHRTVLGREDDLTHKIGVVSLDSAQGIIRGPVLQELDGKVRDEILDLLRLPYIVPLVEIDLKLIRKKHLDSKILAFDILLFLQNIKRR